MTFSISLSPLSLSAQNFTSSFNAYCLSPFRKSSLPLISNTSVIKHFDSYVEVQELGIQIGNFRGSKLFPLTSMLHIVPILPRGP